MPLGGYQPGAGRPRLPETEKRVVRRISLPPWLWEWLDIQADTPGKTIEHALCSDHNLTEKGVAHDLRSRTRVREFD